MNQRRLKDTDRNLLVAQLVFQQAAVRHRAEATEQTHRMVEAAQSDLMEARRESMLASWNEHAQHTVACPRCHQPQTTSVWVGDESDSEVPAWAANWARAGVPTATHYRCDKCDFQLSLLAGERASA